MAYFFRIIKRIFFWSYARNTWQWDVLCALILAFIFLTPKSWFETGELKNSPTHQSPVARTVLISPETLSIQPDKGEIERRARTMIGRPDAEVVNWHPRIDANGKVVAYEVDIR